MAGTNSTVGLAGVGTGATPALTPEVAPGFEVLTLFGLAVGVEAEAFGGAPLFSRGAFGSESSCSCVAGSEGLAEAAVPAAGAGPEAGALVAGAVFGGFAGAEEGAADPLALFPPGGLSGGLSSPGLVSAGLLSDVVLAGRRNVGGLSSSSRGLDSACIALGFLGAAPSTSHSPSASHAFVCCCCRTFFTVNRPSGFPVRWAS